MKIEVTAEDIEKGARLNACSCPIARAIRRALPQCSGVRVLSSSIAFMMTTAAGESKTFLTLTGAAPPGVREFVERFDDAEPVSPFVFDIDDAAVAKITAAAA